MEEELHEFKVIKRVNKSTHNCEEINIINPYEYTKPVVFCFTGNSGIDMKTANGFAKSIKTNAEENDDVEFISIKYREKGYAGTFLEFDVENFVECFFLPLIQKNGKKISLEKIKQNLRKITIVTYCYGANFLRSLNIVLEKELLKLGYPKDKLSWILKNVVNISYAPYCENNKNTCFNFKSFDDDTFGDTFKEEAEKLVRDMPPKHQKKYFVSGKMYVGNGVIFNNQQFNVYLENLTGIILKRQDDHMIGSILKNSDGDMLSRYDNLHGHTASKMFKYILKNVILNSIENEQEFKPLDVKAIEKECNKIIESANVNETEVIKREVLKNSLEHITPEEAFARMRITEKDFLEGKVNIDKINRSIVGIVDWKDSIYKKISWIYCNPNVCFKEYKLEDINCTEIMPHKKGVILASGELVTISNEEKLEHINLALLNKGKSLEGSIKYTIMKRNGKNVITLSDNYGSKGENLEDTFSKQIEMWKRTYNQNTFTMFLTKKQEIVIKNLCTYFDVNKNNIRFLLESTIII